MENLLKNARISGRLNISNRNLNEIPSSVLKLEDQLFGEKWWTVSPLLKLDISYNNISEIPDDLALHTELKTLHAMNNKVIRLLL